MSIPDHFVRNDHIRTCHALLQETSTILKVRCVISKFFYQCLHYEAGTFVCEADSHN